MNKKIIVILLIIFASALFSEATASADNIKKIALFPFEIHSRTNAASLQESFEKGFPSELLKSKYIQVIDWPTITNAVQGKRVDNATALSVGKALGADMAITAG